MMRSSDAPALLSVHMRFVMSGSVPPFLATDPDVYEHFMGRWSRRLANPFLEFAGIQPGDHVLDVGCGTGVLTLALAERGCKAVGTDASEPYLEGARRHRSHPAVTYELGDARRMHYADAAFDACVSTLAIDVIPEVDQVAAEMRRVTRPGGIVACAVFDFWGGFSAEDLVYDTGSVLDEGISALRDYMKARPLCGQTVKRSSGAGPGWWMWWKSRSSSASTTARSRTTGPASRSARPGSLSG
jgi:SAM-dependent methyltransferase